MALRLRRGTDAERQLITPAEGELIYTTDTKSVYIGDGTTVGGIIISGEIGLGDLSEVDLSTPPTVGQVLKWDGVKFVPSSDLEGIAAGDGVIEGSNYRINITANDSTVIVDTETSTFTGNFVGDGSGLTNLPGVTISSIFDLDDVFAFTPPDPNDFLRFDGVNFTPQKILRIEGADSTVILDAETNTFSGRFVGDGSGLTNVPAEIIDGSNYRINIVGEDSSIIVNTAINEISATTGKFNQFISDPDINPEIEFTTIGIDQTDVIINTFDNFGRLSFYRTSDDDISGDNLRYGQIRFGSDDINGRTESAIISSNRDFIWMGHRTGGSIQNEDIMFMTNGDTGFGTTTPQAKVDINGSLITRGNATITGSITAASFNGSLVTDDSTTIIDAIDGSITAQSFVQFGSLTATERDTLNASNGMVIYNTTANKFQGYQNGAWINLDDGSAA